MSKAKIVILGGGFGGLFTALELGGSADVTLVSDADHFLFTPMLYEYLSGEVEAWHIAPRYAELRRARARARRNHQLRRGRGCGREFTAVQKAQARRQSPRSHGRGARSHSARHAAAGRAS